MSTIEITIITKDRGPLTKRISLAADGTVHSDGSACKMAHGRACRKQINGVKELAELIKGLKSNQAIVLGQLRADLADEVKIVPKSELNGHEHNVIARTRDTITYRAGQHTFALADHDTKGMTRDVADRMTALGGFWEALVSVVPELAACARLTRRSTSAGLRRSDTKEQLKGSSGVHIYIAVKNGADIERFLQTLHDRCWLAGLGWIFVGVAGQLLERSIIDRVVGTAERLVFEGPPDLVPPLEQDEESRRPVVVDGDALDTLAACPPLTVTERSKVEAEKAKAAHTLQGEVATVRAAWVELRAERMVARTGMAMTDARRVAEMQCRGILLPDVELKFDNEELARTTVSDVLKNPERYIGENLADPVEGDAYRGGPAKIVQRYDGTLAVHSFAHGGSIYELKYDAASVRKAIEAASAGDAIETFVKLAVIADLDDIEETELRDLAMERSGSGAKARAVNNMVKAAKKKRAQDHAGQERIRRVAERNDPRPYVCVPEGDAPWQPEMNTINEGLISSQDEKPPSRDIDNDKMLVRRLRLRLTHAFTSSETEEKTS
jgi:hypothetical protein